MDYRINKLEEDEGAFASTPAVNTTLSLLYGPEDGVEQVANDTAIHGAAYVAFKKARQAEEEEIRLMKAAAAGLAAEGNSAAVQQAVQEMQQPKQPQTFFSDVQISAARAIETFAAQNNMTPTEVANRVEAMQDAIALRATLEATTTSLAGRSGAAQLVQDIFGLTTAEDWARLSPVVNEIVEQKGGERSLTMASSAQQFMRVLQSMPVAERAKFVEATTKRLVSTVGEKDAKRFYDAVLNLTEQSTALEGAFGALDVLGITAIAKGGVRALLRASRPIAVADAVGAKEAVVKDLTSTILTGKSVLGVSTDEAVAMSNTSKVIPAAVDTAAPAVQQQLKQRAEQLMKELRESLYTGGATADEVIASMRSYEDVYSRANNPALIKSELSAFPDKGVVKLDATYGNTNGNVFATKEAAEEFARKRLGGSVDVEVVPAAGKAEDIATRLKEANDAITESLAVLGKAKKAKGGALAAKFAEANRPASEVIDTVMAKAAAGETLTDPLEKAVSKVIVGATDKVQAYTMVQQAVPEEVLPALRKLEDAVATKVELETMPPKPGYVVRQRMDLPVLLKDIGSISRAELDDTILLLGKINPRLSTAESIYGPAFLAGLKRTAAGKKKADFVAASFDKLKGTEVEKVNNALVATEKLGRDMSVLELQSHGLLTENAQEAYYAFRTMRNIEWVLKEQENANQFISKGYRNVFIGMGADVFSGPAKQVSAESMIGRKVYDTDKQKHITLTTENMNEFSGMVFYEFAKGQNISGYKSAITRVATRPNTVTVGDIKNTVGRVDGAYSRIYQDEFFIKVKTKMTVDDELQDVTYTWRTASTEKDADSYVKGFNDLVQRRMSGTLVTADDVAKALGSYEDDAFELATKINGGDFNGSTLSFNFDRLEGNYFRNVVGIGSNDKSGGRVFWSGRGDKALRSISTGSSESLTVGPLQSLQAEISNTSAFTALGEWRRVAVQRWYNTFEDVIDESFKTGAKDAEQVFFRVANFVGGTPLGETANATKMRQMLSHKDFILTQLGVKTRDEMAVHNVVAALSNSRIADIPGFAHVGKWLRQADLPQFLKSASSTMMLGMWSFSQLVVQSSGMALAVAISPKHGLKAAYATRPILAALASDNPAVWKWFHKVMDVAQYAGMKSDEFVRVAAAIRKSGWIDNIGASSLYGAEDGATNIFAKGRRKFQQSQMMFFNKGEEISRVASFDIARREWMETNPGKAWDSDEALKAITFRADDLTMNMTRTNEARWQQGWFGIPFQFLQHNMRLGTNVLAGFAGKGAISRKEVYSLVLGSYLLYGINNNATYDPLEEWLGEQANSLSPEMKQYLTQGLVAGILSSVIEFTTGEEFKIALGQRLSSVQWYEDMADAITRVYQTGEFDFGAIWGPTGSTIANLWGMGKTFGRFIEKEEWVAADFGRTVSEAVGSMVSSWRGIDKAYWAYHANGALENMRGDTVARLSSAELIAQALGFQSTEAAEANFVFTNNRDYNIRMEKYADTFMQFRRLSQKAKADRDVKSEEANAKAMFAILTPLPMADRQYIMRLVRERNPTDTVLMDALVRWEVEMSSHKNKLMVNNPYGEPDGN
jgi:hypothetical protein